MNREKINVYALPGIRCCLSMAFFRDIKYLNYWGRIPAQLEQNGAKVYYGNQQSALGVKETAQELAERIRYIYVKKKAVKK